jgi:hypothetical protein
MSDDADDFLNLARALDPALLMNDLGMIPDPWQERLLRCRSNRVLLLCSRQLGKSTATACLGLHQAAYVPGSDVLLVSRSERQSGELFMKVSQFYRRLRPVESIKQLLMSMELANGSRIIALPGDGDTVRGYSAPALVIIDEASRVPDDVLAAVLPMLVANQGRLICLSTPRGKRGFFFERWTSGDPSWDCINARACDSPRFSPEALAEQLASLGPRLYAQEFENAFLEETDQVFSHDSIDAIFEDDLDGMPWPALEGF